MKHYKEKIQKLIKMKFAIECQRHLFPMIENKIRNCANIDCEKTCYDCFNNFVSDMKRHYTFEKDIHSSVHTILTETIYKILNISLR